MRIVRLPGVFNPIADSRMLAEALEDQDLPAGARILDLCTGSGIMAVTAARRGWDATAVDVSRRAVLTARLNARLNGVRVRARRGSLFEPVAGERFDCITANPPYVPSTDVQLPSRGSARAWAAGRDGRTLLDRICDQVADHLRPAGVVLLVHSSLIETDETLRRLNDAGLVEGAVVERHRGPLGPLMQAQQRDGTIPADVTTEDVVIIRACAPATVDTRSAASTSAVAPEA